MRSGGDSNEDSGCQPCTGPPEFSGLCALVKRQGPKCSGQEALRPPEGPMRGGPARKSRLASIPPPSPPESKGHACQAAPQRVAATLARNIAVTLLARDSHQQMES
jgi:hypothetical protein